MKTIGCLILFFFLIGSFTTVAEAKKFNKYNAQIKQLQLFTVQETGLDSKGLFGIEIIKIDGKRPKHNKTGFISTTAGPTELLVQVGQVDPNSNQINQPINHNFMIEVEESKEYIPHISFEEGYILFWYHNTIDEIATSEPIPTEYTVFEIIAVAEDRELRRQEELENQMSLPVSAPPDRLPY